MEDMREDEDDPGHIWRSPAEHFNQRAQFLAKRFQLEPQDVMDAYRNRPGDLKDIFLEAQDTRTLTNMSVPLAMIAAPVALAFPVIGGPLFAAVAGYGYYNYRKHENIGEGIRGEVAKIRSPKV